MPTPKIPDTSKWLPGSKTGQTLKLGFANRCTTVEAIIAQRVVAERATNLNNFDSGSGIEDIIREELGRILPDRYKVTCGVLNDRDGKSAGDVDIVIFNHLWFPHIKAGATVQSRRFHFPIEGAYAVGEIKQTLNFKSLDDAMEKLVICHRLNRPQTFNHRVVENREATSCIHGLSNPLYSFILATGIEEGIEMDQLVERFCIINKSMKRLDVVRALCVLGVGTVVWGSKDRDKNEFTTALFMEEDLYEPIFPIYYKQPQAESALYALISNLSNHLFHSVLAAEDIAAAYGPAQHQILQSKDSNMILKPDFEWLAKLQIECPDH